MWVLTTGIKSFNSSLNEFLWCWLGIIGPNSVLWTAGDPSVHFSKGKVLSCLILFDLQSICSMRTFAVSSTYSERRGLLFRLSKKLFQKELAYNSLSNDLLYCNVSIWLFDFLKLSRLIFLLKQHQKPWDSVSAVFRSVHLWMMILPLKAFSFSRILN